MTISKELEASILRYHHVEKWRVGTIANQLHVHHSVVICDGVVFFQENCIAILS